MCWDVNGKDMWIFSVYGNTHSVISLTKTHFTPNEITRIDDETFLEVPTLGFFLGLLFNSVLSQCCTYDLVMFSHKNHLIRVRTGSRFRFKIPVLVATMTGTVTIFFLYKCNTV